jgi:hypothetical protein
MKIRAYSSTSLAILVGIAASGSMICETAFAQAPRTLYLYNSTPGRGRGFQAAAVAKPWGNGNIRATRSRTIDYEGASVQEIDSKNFAEGVRFDLNSPLDLTPYQEQGFLRLRLRFRNAQPAGMPEGGFPGGGFPGGGFPGGGFPGGGFPGGGFPGGGFPGGGFPGGGFPGGGFPGGGFQPNSTPVPAPNDQLNPVWIHNAQFTPPQNGALPQFGAPGFPGMGEVGPDGLGVPTGPPPQKTDITELRVTFMRETGVTVGRIPIDLEEVQSDANGWRLFILPIRDTTSTKNAAGMVKRILLSSDREDKFYLAQAALAVETGKMTVSIRPTQDPAGTQIGEIVAKPGRITLVADVEAGTADPSIEWDFDADKTGNLPAPALNAGAFAQPTIDGTTAPEIVGPRIDARGITATFDYPNEEQNYRVQVTVRDKTGKKAPATASVLVKIRG